MKPEYIHFLRTYYDERFIRTEGVECDCGCEREEKAVESNRGQKSEKKWEIKEKRMDLAVQHYGRDSSRMVCMHASATPARYLITQWHVFEFRMNSSQNMYLFNYYAKKCFPTLTAIRRYFKEQSYCPEDDSRDEMKALPINSSFCVSAHAKYIRAWGATPSHIIISRISDNSDVYPCTYVDVGM